MGYIDFWRLAPARNEQVNVTATDSIISESRTEVQPRIDIALQNVSTTKGVDLISIRFGSDGVATTAMWTLDVGDTLIMSSSEGYPCFQDTIHAICATANGKLNILER